MRIAHLAMNHKHLDNVDGFFANVQIDEQVFYFEKLSDKESKLPMYKSKIVQFNCFDAQDYEAIAVELSGYNIVLVHCLTKLHISIINEIDKRFTKIIWVGWGVDYLDLMYDSFFDVLLEKSRALYLELKVGAKTDPMRYQVSADKIAAIRKIDFFSPVLEEEFEMVKQRYDFTSHLIYIDWMYNFDYSSSKLLDYKKNIAKGNSLWLGNSATITNNHADYLEIVEHNQHLKDIDHYIPLSYGFDNYKEAIKLRSQHTLSNHSRVLEGFLDFEAYTKLIVSCKYMVMNHVRQQGMGNVWLGFLSGCSVFLERQSPAYQYFKKQGYNVFSVEQLGTNANLEDFLLNDIESANNFEKITHALSVVKAKDRALTLINIVTNRE